MLVSSIHINWLNMTKAKNGKKNGKVFSRTQEMRYTRGEQTQGT